PATDGRFLAECVAVDGVACRIVLGEDAGGDLASTSSGGRRGQMSGAGVEADVAPVVGDLEGVVQVHALGVDGVGAVAKSVDEVAHFLAGLEVHDAVFARPFVRQVGGHLVARHGVSELTGHAHYVTDDCEISSAGDRTEYCYGSVDVVDLCEDVDMAKK